MSNEIEFQQSSMRKQVRVQADGCFDLAHQGHMNALRQAKMLGDYLVVGVHTDSDILKHKGPSVLNEQERYEALRACKQVDEVVEAAPYITSLEILDQYNIDFCVHGEDISTDEYGNDVYEAVKRAGRYRTICRTEGVSTTDIVGRMILHTKQHLLHRSSSNNQSNDNYLPLQIPASKLKLEEQETTKQPSKNTDSINSSVLQNDSLCQFFPSTRNIAQFSEGNRAPTLDDTIVYIDGVFDLFHIGHISALKTAKSMGTYLIVGVHDDMITNQKKRDNRPIMNLYERVLSVLACRYVDEVVIGSPWKLSKDFIKHYKINKVCKGSFNDHYINKDENNDEKIYEVSIQMGIFCKFPSRFTDLTSEKILERILSNMSVYEQRNKRKEVDEVEQKQKQSELKFFEADCVQENDKRKYDSVEMNEKAKTFSKRKAL